MHNRPIKTAIRFLAGLVCVVLTGACNSPPREPGPEYVHQLPRCDDQARLAHVLARDCTFVFGAADWGPGSWLHVRFTPSGSGVDAGAVAIDLYSDRTELAVISEKGVSAYDYPFMMDVTGEGGDDIFLPVERRGRWLLSVWPSNFLDDYYHHSGAYTHAGEIPLGRVLHLDPNLFVETSSGFGGPWKLTLYRANQTAIEKLGDLVATGNSSRCKVTGASIALLGGTPAVQVQQICAWFATPRDYYDAYGQSVDRAAALPQAGPSRRRP